MLATLHALNDSMIEEADFIVAKDADDLFWGLTILGQGAVPCCRPHPAGPQQIKVLEVQLDKSKVSQLQLLLREVLRVNGWLPMASSTLLLE